MKIKQAGNNFLCALFFLFLFLFVLFCILFFGQGRKKPATKRNETKVDAKQAVNRNESTSKLNFVHGCTHDLKQRAANKRMSRQKEAKSESHMRWDEAKGLAGLARLALACQVLPVATLTGQANKPQQQQQREQQPKSVGIMKHDRTRKWSRLKFMT